MDANYSREDDKFNFDNSNELALTTGPSSTENRARLKNRFASKKNRQTADAKGLRRLESSGFMKASPKNEENKQIHIDEEHSVEFDEVDEQGNKLTESQSLVRNEFRHGN